MLLVLALVLGIGLAACSDGDGTGAGRTTTTVTEAGSGAEDGGVNSLAVDMKEYSYALSGQLQAGTSTVSLKNSGAELHMAAFSLLKDGKTEADVQAALRSEDDSALESVVEAQLDAPGTVLSPGRSEKVTTDLLGAGTYAIICFIPTAGESAPIPHAAKGMLATFTVAPGAVEGKAARPDAEYTIDDGRNDGPPTLKAGENALRMTSAGAGPHEFIVARKSTPSTTYDDIDTFFTDLFESDKAPPTGYADTAPGIIAASSFDVATGKTILVTVDLEPGDYLIGCALSGEEEGDKDHTGEMLEVKVT